MAETVPVAHFDIATIDRPIPRALLDLNQADEDHLSFLDEELLDRLVAQAFLAIRIGTADSMLIAFDQDADYRSPNFLWFKERHSRFVYIDRVVVAPAFRGRGHARALYRALFRQASRQAHTHVVCEVNAEPPNPGSDAFHRRMGFTAIGAGMPVPGKRVSYLMRALPSPALR